MASEPYFLRSERLGFRWWRKKDLPLARRLWGDREVTKFFGGPFADEEIERRLLVELDSTCSRNSGDAAWRGKRPRR